MIAGKLRHRVYIQRATEAANTYGEMVKTWASIYRVWASVEPLTGRELERAQQVSAEATTRVKIRYTDDVTVGDRILFGTYDQRVFEINAIVNPDERNVELHLFCSEAVQ